MSSIWDLKSKVLWQTLIAPTICNVRGFDVELDTLAALLLGDVPT